MTAKALRLDIDALPTELPDQLSLEFFRYHCHVDASSPPTTLEDQLLTSYIKAAIEWFETETRRSLLVRTHRWTLEDFPYYPHAIELPRGKTRSVSTITYSQNGETQTLTGPSASPAGTSYQEDLSGFDGGVLMPPRGETWPGIDCDVVAPVVITFEAGWDDGAIPSDIVHALLFYVSDAVEQRGTPDLERTGSYLKHREAMVSSYYIKRQW